MNRPRAAAFLCLIALTPAAVLALRDPGQEHGPVDVETDAPPEPLAREVLLDRLNGFGAAIREASPCVEKPASAARQEAAGKLARLAVLIDSGDDHVRWGTLEEDEPIGLDGRTGWAISSLALVKINLSMFTFEGEHRIEEAGDLILLRLPARLREGLEPEEFPAPMWNQPAVWRAHLSAQEIILVFRGEHLQAALVRAGPEAAPMPASLWTVGHPWSASKGGARASQFAFLFSVENPEAPALSRAYRELNACFTTHGCLSCHSHDSQDPSGRRFILNVQNDAIAVRNALPELLARTEFAETDPHRAIMQELRGTEAHETFGRAAESFQTASNHALAYEAARRALRLR